MAARLTPPVRRVLLVGGGHAMLPLLVGAEALVRRGVAVTLLSDAPRLWYSGMVPEYLGGVYTREQATIDLRAWCARTGVVFAEDTAAHLDAEARTVTTAGGETLGFDLAAFDIGGANPHRGAAEGAIPTKPLHHVEALQAQVEAALATGGPCHVVIVGGGAAGTEVALNLSARALAVRPGALALTILEPSDALLSGFPRGMQRHARHLLETRGAVVRTGARARLATDTQVTLETGETLDADAVLWATGSEGQPLFRAAGLPVDDRGWVRVSKTLQVENHPHLLAAGDCAVVAGHEGLARIGVHAVKQGPVLCANVFALASGEAARRRFRPYPIAPLVLSTGADEGLWTSGPLWLKGRALLRLKHAIDRRWMRNYLFGGDYAALFDARAADDA